MWEKLNKVQVQNIAFMVILVGCFVIATISFFIFPVEQAERVISKIIDITLVGAIGWGFTSSKQRNEIK
jgi:hypothetical protein